MTKSILMLACGNPSRGDDALGPLLLDWIAKHCDVATVELLCDFQWQIEHALDLRDRKLVLFIDASETCTRSFELSELKPVRDESYTTHAMSAETVMAICCDILQQSLPDCFLLSVKGESFALGEGLSDAANDNLQQAAELVERLLNCPNVERWRQYSIHLETVGSYA